MFRKSLFTTGLCAASLSVAMLAGCSSPVTAPTTPTEAAGTPVAAPGAPGAEPAAPALQAPAAVAPATLSGKATFRGEALSGYAVSVFDAQTGKAVDLKADLAGVTTLAVLNQNLVTDAQGGFSLQVVGLKAGQALRVVVSKGNGSLETVVTSDLKAVGSAKLHVLAEGGNLAINELTTAIAKVARGVLSTTQVLTPEAAAPVLAKLATELASLSTKLEAALAKNPNLASGLISNESKAADSAVKSLVESAGAIKDLTKAIAGLVGEVAKAAKETGNQSAGANDDAVKAALAKVEFAGTVLAGKFANNGFTLTNSATGESADAENPGTVADTVNKPSSSSSGGTPVLQTGSYATIEAFGANDNPDILDGGTPVTDTQEGIAPGVIYNFAGVLRTVAHPIDDANLVHEVVPSSGVTVTTMQGFDSTFHWVSLPKSGNLYSWGPGPLDFRSADSTEMGVIKPDNQPNDFRLAVSGTGSLTLRSYIRGADGKTYSNVIERTFYVGHTKIAAAAPTPDRTGTPTLLTDSMTELTAGEAYQFAGLMTDVYETVTGANLVHEFTTVSGNAAPATVQGWDSSGKWVNLLVPAPLLYSWGPMPLNFVASGGTGININPGTVNDYKVTFSGAGTVNVKSYIRGTTLDNQGTKYSNVLEKTYTIVAPTVE
jgi:hypothetical protein